uniref:F-box domain-containing protein n=1 Tax=Bionectria ochroleuca TaxID=29856 RepID=A0A8H7NC81_BIOOC
MGAPILTLPMEVLLQIAEQTWFSGPCSEKPARDHAALIRTCRGLYQALNADLYKKTKMMSPLMEYCVVWAIRNGRLCTIKRAHVNGADLTMSVETNIETEPRSMYSGVLQPRRLRRANYSLIHVAVLHGDLEIINYLLDHGANVHAPSFGLCICPKVCWQKDFQAQYPLHFLFCHTEEGRRLEIAEKLISKGAHLVAENTSAIPQLAKFTQGHLLESLIKKKDNDSLAGVLHLAVQMQNLSLVTQLYKSPLNESITRATDWEGRTALHMAVNSFNWKEEIVRFFLQQNRASMLTRDSKGFTPLYFAAISICSPKLVDLLLQHRDALDERASAHFREIFFTIYNFRHETTNHLDIAQQLINAWLKPLHDISAYHNPLYAALLKTKWRIALRLIRDGIDLPSWGSSYRKRGTVAIWPSLIACLSSFHPEQTEFVDAIVRTGCDLNPQSSP